MGSLKSEGFMIVRWKAHPGHKKRIQANRSPGKRNKPS